MERLTWKSVIDGHEDVGLKEGVSVGDAILKLVSYEDTGLSPETVSDLLDRFNYFRRTIEGLDLVDHVHFGAFVDRVKRWAQAEKDGRLVVLEPCKAAKEGAKKPTCFYNDMGQEFCLGFGRGTEDDEPIDKCKECWYCEFSSVREEAEAALKRREADDEHLR